MVDIIKQDMTDIWAVAGDVVAPDSAKVRAGWAVEAVPRQWWNWFENRQDTNIAYMLQKGIPEWDQFTEYLTNKSYVQRNNVVYKCILTGVNKDPSTTPANWIKAFSDSTPFLEAVKGLGVQAMSIPAFNGSSVATYLPYGGLGQQVLSSTTAGQGRSFLDAQQANTNLTALSGIVAATNALPYFTGTTTAGTTTLTAFGRSLIATNNAAAVKTLLGLGNAADYTVQGTLYDSTVNRLLLVGAFGLGANAIPITDPDVPFRPTGYYDVEPSVTWTARPIAGWTRIHHISHANASGYATQYAVGNFAGGPNIERYYVRTVVAGVWGNWSEYWTSRNLTLTTGTTDSTIGRVSKIGDLGYGGPSILDTNANTPRASGSYAFLGGTNTPVSAFQMASQDWGGDGTGWQAQFGQEIGNNRAFFRSILKSGASSTAWAELYHTGNVQQLTDIVTAGVVAQVNAQLALKQDVATVNVTSGPTDNVDPDGLTIPWALVTHANAPDASRYWFINTMFYLNKATGGKTQTAIEYNPSGPARSYVRSCITNVWTVWVRTDANAVAPTATRLATPRTINGVSFDGTSNVVVPSVFSVGETLTGPGTWSMRGLGGTGVTYDTQIRVENYANAGDGTGVIGLIARAVTSTGSFVTGSWFGSTGQSGWVNNTYGGGIYQTDSTWVRVYGNKGFLCDSAIQAQGGFIGSGSSITNIQHANIAAVPQSQAANGWAMLPGGTIIQWMKVTSSSSATDFKFFPRSFPTACTSVSCCIDATAMGDGASYGLNMRVVDNTKFVTVHGGNYVSNGVAFVIATGY